ncbi:Cdc37 Hsp90 binding domain protein [Ostertagia ostertagi]
MPIDYSKWKAIEVSDDEDDTHPNIDTPSLFRWRHQARLERMAEKKQKREEIEKNKSASNSKVEELEKKLKSTEISAEEKEKIEKEIAEIKDQEAKWLAKEKELEEQERLEPWNVDTIGHEAFSYSRINKVGEKKPPPKLSDEEDSKRMEAKWLAKEKELEEQERLEPWNVDTIGHEAFSYSRINKVGEKKPPPKLSDEEDSKRMPHPRVWETKTLEESEEFILEHPHLASEYTANYLTIDALNLAIDNKDDEMCNVARQCIVIQYLLELAKNMNAIPTNLNIIKAFFKKFRSADPQYLKLYTDEVAAFEDRLRRRAKEKRDAALAEYEAEEKEKRIAAAPGGLDPQEVYESLPAEMRAAFDSQDVSKLQEVALTMDREVFAYHFQRCIESGLWVPNANAEEGEHAEEAQEEADTAAAAEKS